MKGCPTCGMVTRSAEQFCSRDGTPLKNARDLDKRINTLIGNYRLRDLIGKGGMGTVYRAEHVYLGKLAAIKILDERFAAESELIWRFLQEARAASSIGHPNIVEVADFGIMLDDHCYYVM